MQAQGQGTHPASLCAQASEAQKQEGTHKTGKAGEAWVSRFKMVWDFLGFFIQEKRYIIVQ